jgi:two-component system, cell cycle response regulator
MSMIHEKTSAVRVLLVGDNPGNANMVRDIAASDPHRPIAFETCTRLSEAMEVARRGPQDLVLLDLDLPDSIGNETFERFHGAFPELPIVVLAGQDGVTIA